LVDPAVWMIEDYLVLGQTEAFKEDFYPKALQKLASISGGKFRPEKIELEECGFCDGRDKRVFLRFEWEGNERAVNFCIDGGGLVLDFVEELNETLAETGFAYQVVRDPYGLCFVLFLSELQARELAKDQAWEWAEFSGYWFERARFAREKEDWESAKMYFEKVRTRRFDPAAYSEYGMMLSDLGEFEQAALLYKSAIRKLSRIKDRSLRDEWWLRHFDRSFEGLR
jgi:tetratricopeptide (TPR) repeat protein